MGPLSQFKFLTPLLVALSALHVLVLIVMGGTHPLMLLAGWLMAGLLAEGVFYILSRFKLQGGQDVRAFAITWPLMSLTFAFSICHLLPPEPNSELPFLSLDFLNLLVFPASLLLMLTVTMSLWQKRQSILKHLFIGLLIGLTSTLMSHAIFWVIFPMMAGYYMRSWSTRNVLGIFTGVIFGVWFVYCLLFIYPGMPVADAMIGRYLFILSNFGQSHPFAGLNVWSFLFLVFLAILLAVYSISGQTLGKEQSMRADASIQLISLQSIVMLLLLLDSNHISTYICLLALFLSIQLTIHQSNLKSVVGEWWIIAILLIGMMMSVIPLV